MNIQDILLCIPLTYLTYSLASRWNTIAKYAVSSVPLLLMLVNAPALNNWPLIFVTYAWALTVFTLRDMHKRVQTTTAMADEVRKKHFLERVNDAQEISVLEQQLAMNAMNVELFSKFLEENELSEEFYEFVREHLPEYSVQRTH